MHLQFAMECNLSIVINFKDYHPSITVCISGPSCINPVQNEVVTFQ